MKQDITQSIKAGDSNRITREYFDSLLVEMRLIGSAIPSATLELYGETFSTPIMTAALSHLHNTCPNGAAEMATGAFTAKAVMWTGMGDEAELESIIATGARTVKIVKPYINNDTICRKLEHAEKSGAFAVGMDIDHWFDRKGQYDNVLGFPMAVKSFDEIKGFIRASKLPFIIKGVLSVQDAYKCAEAGAKGIVVSHHHGIMDYAVPPLMILPEIVKVIDHSIPVFVDCGISSGIDAFKALALGADAVCAGRVLMEPLKSEKADGVRKKLEEMTAELAGMMARTGSHDIRHIDPTVIWRR